MIHQKHIEIRNKILFNLKFLIQKSNIRWKNVEIKKMLFPPGDGGVQEEVQWGVWEADGEKQAVPETTGAVRLSEAA